MIPRRNILGLILAAPAVIRTPGLLMPVRRVRTVWDDLNGSPWRGGYNGILTPTLMIQDVNAIMRSLFETGAYRNQTNWNTSFNTTT